MSICKILTGKTVDQLGTTEASAPETLTIGKSTLEDEIELLNDEINGVGGFENYTIVEEQA